MQRIERSNSSSDFSVDHRSDFLEVIQKIKKVDPDVLILNLDENDPYELSQSDNSESDLESDEGKSNLYVFAGFVPPGKHTILVRDCDNFHALAMKK